MPRRFLWLMAMGAITLFLAAHTAVASIPGTPPWGSDYQLVFSQDFTTMSSLSQLGVNNTSIGSGTWIAHTASNEDFAPFIYTTTNYDPFGVGSGYLDIRGQQNQSTSNGFDGFSCGDLCSMDSTGAGFAQKYGYFEVSMQTPGGPNTWPAFWLVDSLYLTDPSAYNDTAEIDITESFGTQEGSGDPNVDHVTWHDWATNSSYTTQSGTNSISEPGMTSGYHQYGVDIEPDYITWYFDRQEVWQVPTFAAAQRPMYMQITLALQNYANDYSATDNPSDLKVQYAAVWASPASPNYSGPAQPPTGLSATAGNQVAVLSWNPSLGASSYNIYRGTSSGGESATPIATGVTATTYNDTGLTNGTTYYYEVASVDPQGTSGKSNEASAEPRYGPPLAPKNLTATQGDTQSSLSWTASPDATSYEIFRGSYAGGESPTAVATGITGTTYTDSGLTNGTPYFYYVEGVNSAGAGSPSNEANAIPASANGSVAVAYASTPPTIDGTDSSAWSDAVVYPVGKLDFGAPTSTDATFATMWDSNYLYALYTVDANVLVDGTPDYNGSAVELYLDVTNGKSNSYTSSDFRYSLGFNHTTINEYAQNKTTGVEFAQSTFPGGYREEIAIPWSTLGVTPWSGASIGIDASVDDSTSASVGRTSQLDWYNTSAADYYDPQELGNGTLEPANPSPPTPGTYELINVNSGLALEVPSGTVGNGTDLDQASYSGASYQKWSIAPGYFGGFSLQNVSTSQVADTGPSYSVGDVVEWNPNSIPDNDNTQLYTLVKLGSYYQITDMFSGRVLDVNGSSTSAGASIIQNNATQSDNSQLWNLVLISGSAPSAPTGLTATGGNGEVTLSWNASMGATSYNVYRGTSSGSESGTPIATGVTSASYTDSSVTNGTTYYYKVAAVNSAGTSSQSNEASATPTGSSGSPPSAPTGLTATAGNAQVSLSWNSSSGATSYNVYRGTTSGGESGTPIATTVSSTSYTDTSVTNGTTYYYKVAAVNSHGTSGMSNEASATPTSGGGGSSTPFVIGESLGGTLRNDVTSNLGFCFTIGSTPITVTSLGRWVVAGNTQSHTVELLNSSASVIASVVVNTAGQPAGQYAYTSLSSPVTLSANGYYILVSSETAGGDQWYDYSGTVLTTTSVGTINQAIFQTYLGAGVADNSYVPVNFEYQGTGGSGNPPLAPTNLTATPGTSQVALSWTASSGATSYTVYRGTASGGETSLATGISSTSYTDTSVTNGTTYYYEVAAVNSNGTSGKSNEVSAMPISGGSGSSTPFVTGETLGGTLENNYTGNLGFTFTTGSNPITVTSVGRWVVSGNSQSHTVEILGPDGSVLGSAVVNTAGQTAGQYAYASLSTPITLAPNTYYFIVSSETSGGDYWYNYSGTVLTTTSVATVEQAVFQTYLGAGTTDNSYVPVNFEYETCSGSAPAAPTGLTATAGNVQVALSWTASSGATSYNVYRNGALLATNIATTSYTDSAVTNGTTYYYQVAAVNSYGTSAMSNQVSATPNGGNPFVTGETLGGTLRNDYNGNIGFYFEVGSSPITVTSLGRWVVSGNSQSHTVELLDSSANVLATATVNTSGATAGQFAYANLSTPVTLSPYTHYYLVSAETSGGDQWYDYSGTTLTTTGVASVLQACFNTYLGIGGSGNSYVPVNFLYTTTGG